MSPRYGHRSPAPTQDEEPLRLPAHLSGLDAGAGLAGEPMAHTLHQRAESVFASRGPASAWASWLIDVVIAKIIERDLAVSRSPDEDQQL